MNGSLKTDDKKIQLMIGLMSSPSLSRGLRQTEGPQQRICPRRSGVPSFRASFLQPTSLVDSQH